MLEVGCGTGDILVPLAVDGAEVIGVDSSARMLEHLAHRLTTLPREVAARVRLARETAPALPAMDQVDAAILPNDLVAHLIGEDALDELFRNLRRVLRPGGILLLDAERFDVAFLASITGSGGGLTRTHGFFDFPDGRLLRVDEQSAYDPPPGSSPARSAIRSWTRTPRSRPPGTGRCASIPGGSARSPRRCDWPGSTSPRCGRTRSPGARPHPDLGTDGGARA
ncbi:class I SAM-dependent methyltransferase [Nonomuraea thailandensis]